MKVKFGSIIVSGRGTLGGHVYSENHYGPFARTKVSPINPNSHYQQTTRLIFLSVQTAWRGLTQPERDAWHAATPDYPRIDYSGTVYFMTGYNLFIAINLPYYTSNLAILATPPTKSIPTASCDGALTLNYASFQFDMTFITPPNEANVEIYAFGTRPLSAGVNYVSTELRLMTLFPAVGSNPISLFASWTTKFINGPLSGQKIFIKLVPVNVSTGDYGVPFTFSAIEP